MITLIALLCRWTLLFHACFSYRDFLWPHCVCVCARGRARACVRACARLLACLEILPVQKKTWVLWWQIKVTILNALIHTRCMLLKRMLCTTTHIVGTESTVPLVTDCAVALVNHREWLSAWGNITEPDDRQVTTVFTVQPSFHHRHSTNRVSWSVTNRRQTTRWGVTARSPTMVMLHDTRFVECRWCNDGWTVKTVVTWRSSASMIPAPGRKRVVSGLNYPSFALSSQGHRNSALTRSSSRKLLFRSD